MQTKLARDKTAGGVLLVGMMLLRWMTPTLSRPHEPLPTCNFLGGVTHVHNKTGTTGSLSPTGNTTQHTEDGRQPEGNKISATLQCMHSNTYRQHTLAGFSTIYCGCLWGLNYPRTSHQLPAHHGQVRDGQGCEIMQASLNARAGATLHPVKASRATGGRAKHPHTTSSPRSPPLPLALSLSRPQTQHLLRLQNPARMSAPPPLEPAFDSHGPRKLPELCRSPVKRLPLFVREVQAHLDDAVVGVRKRHPFPRGFGLLSPHVVDASPSRYHGEDAQRGDRRESSLPHLLLLGDSLGYFQLCLLCRSPAGARSGCCAASRPRSKKAGGFFHVRSE